uniref:Uncharacterized protein n=1 Tax=Arundo donax TaxID=35708 RepID=A0A0A9HRQ0_ARUDO
MKHRSSMTVCMSVCVILTDNICFCSDRYVIDGYRNLPFPFDDVGLGREGEPMGVDMEHEMSFEGLIGMLRSWSAVVTAKERGVDLLGERVAKEMEEECGGASLVRKVTFKAFLLAGTRRADG